MKRRHSIFGSLLSLLFMCAVIGGIWYLIKPYMSKHKQESVEFTHHLSILTWNTARMGGFKKPGENQVLQLLSRQDADIICLQEVDVYKNNRFLTLQDVRDVLGRKYPYSYLDFSIYDRRHQFGTMVWSRYPLIHKNSIRYETNANLSNRCDVVIGKDTLRLINNHLESYSFTPEDIAEIEQQRNYEGLKSSARKLESKWSRALPIRNKQAQMVREEIDRSPYPVVVVGDFNSIAWSYAYWHISKGLHDAWKESGRGRLGATCEKRGIGIRIDYILCSDPLLPEQCTVLPLSGSDHHPVCATLGW